MNQNIEFIKKQFIESASVKLHLMETESELIETIAKIIVKAFQNKKKIVLFGNGGSAADAQHIAAEWVGRFYKNRKSLPAVALTTDTSVLTAIGNDFGYENIFSRQVEGLVNKGDVVIGISTSGQSLNILNGLLCAKKKNAITIGLTSQKGKAMQKIVDYCLMVPSDYTPHIQESHITVLHIICALVEKKLFS